jgi:hypothetical protein
MTNSLCYGCKTFKEVAYIQPGTDHGFCVSCRWDQPITLEDVALFLLTTPGSPIGPPFAVGDVVEARVAGILYDGIGTIAEMSMTLERGAGTPVYPTFRVVFTEKADTHDVPDECFYPENCLTPVKKEVVAP